MAYDRGGPVIQGTEVRAGPMTRVRGGPGGGVIGGTPPDPTWDW